MTDRNKSPANEKRRSSRRRLEVEGTLTSLSEGVQRRDVKVLTRDISPDGVYLLTDTVVPIGERVKVQLRSPSSKKSKTASSLVFFGTVVRTERLPDGKVGLVILFLEPAFEY